MWGGGWGSWTAIFFGGGGGEFGLLQLKSCALDMLLLHEKLSSFNIYFIGNIFSIYNGKIHVSMSKCISMGMEKPNFSLEKVKNFLCLTVWEPCDSPFISDNIK